MLTASKKLHEMDAFISRNPQLLSFNSHRHLKPKFHSSSGTYEASVLRKTMILWLSGGWGVVDTQLVSTCSNWASDCEECIIHVYDACVLSPLPMYVNGFIKGLFFMPANRGDFETCLETSLHNYEFRIKLSNWHDMGQPFFELSSWNCSARVIYFHVLVHATNDTPRLLE